MKRYMLIGTGCVSLALGVIGIFLPVLPTTPFLLLAAGCFVRSSDSLYRWLTGHKFLGSYIKNYLQFRAITVRAKIVSIALLWSVIITTAVFFVSVLILRILLPAIAVAVSVHIATMKTLTPEMLAAAKTRDEKGV